MNRREFIVSSLASIPVLTWSARSLAALEGAKSRVLVLVELAGGNDGLRTVIPYGDADYRRLRPTLAIERDRVMMLDERVGLHPGLEPLMNSWNAGDLAVVQGVGYENPNRSHFRSIEIWETASDSEEYLSTGWVVRSSARLADASEPTTLIVMGDRVEGPMAGGDSHPDLHPIVIDDPARFFSQVRSIDANAAVGGNNALRHILEVQDDLTAASRSFERVIASKRIDEDVFGSRPFGRQLATAARILASDLPVRAIKITLDGFDTHARQQPTHDRLMAELGEGLGALRKTLIASGDWGRVLIMTYSEFGRRAAENGSYGTDHGAAAPHFMLGGRVLGGLYGQAPRLDDLTDGDVRFAVDFRSLYATVARRWWGVSDGTFAQYAPVECIRG